MHFNAVLECSQGARAVDRYTGMHPLATLPKVVHVDFSNISPAVNPPHHRAGSRVVVPHNVVAVSSISKVYDSAIAVESAVFNMYADCQCAAAKRSTSIYGDVLPIGFVVRIPNPVKGQRFRPTQPPLPKLGIVMHRPSPHVVARAVVERLCCRPFVVAKGGERHNDGLNTPSSANKRGLLQGAGGHQPGRIAANAAKQATNEQHHGYESSSYVVL